MSSIILTGGGTAGHCTPHLALLPYLKQNFDKIYYIGSKNGMERNIIEKEDIPYFAVDCIKLKRQFSLDNAKIPFTLLKGIKQVKRIINDVKPSVVFSKGGYVSLPVVLACRNKVPVISHESDYTMGLANKIASRYSKKTLTSFPETAKGKKNVLYMGSPIRNLTKNVSREKAMQFFGFKDDKPILLVMGGSLGATKINSALYKCLPTLLNDFNVIHLCGKNNFNKDAEYNGYFQTEFLDNIGYAYKVASVVVSRAGANSLFEIMLLQLPSVIIPLPKGVSRGDQVLNAKYFNSLGLCDYLDQDCLTPQNFAKAIYNAYSSRFYLKKCFLNAPVNDKSREISNLLANFAR